MTNKAKESAARRSAIVQPFAAYLVVSGCLSAAHLLDVTVLPDGAQAIVMYGMVVATYLVTALGGVLLLLGRKRGREIAFIALALQLPIFQLGRLSYAIISLPTWEFRLWPSFGVAFSIWNTVDFVWHDTSQPTYISLNAIALMVLVWLTNEFPRRVDRRDESVPFT